MHPEYPNLYQRARKATRLTQEEAAERIGVSPESMKQYESGRRVPPDGVVAKMVEVYDLPWLALEHSRATDQLGVLPTAGDDHADQPAERRGGLHQRTAAHRRGRRD